MSKKTLTQLFFKRLTLIVLVTLTITTALAWTAQTHQSEQTTDMLLSNVISYVFMSITYIDAINEQSNITITHENISSFYGRHLPVVKSGGLIIVENGTIIGDALVPENIGQTLEVVGISENDISGTSGHFHLNRNGMMYQCYYETQNNVTVISLLPNSIAFEMRNMSVTYLFIGYLFLFATLYAGIFLLLRRFVLAGVLNINASLSKITNGDLDEKVSVYNNYEFSQLSDSINTMVDALKEAIDREAARLDAELKYAHEIQKASLPKLMFLPNDERFRLFASMTPAKEVGGDFYDFFMMDEHRLCAVVADVSGKGIPAALYMMSVKDKIRSAVLAKDDLSQAFFSINNDLCASESNMFVTVFISILDLNSGKVTALNAGHNPPLIDNGDSFEFLSGKPNFVLAGLENSSYKTLEFNLNDGGVLFMYTDGVTECMDKEDGFFGESRLKDCLNASGKDPEQLISAVRTELKDFSNGIDPSDDVTMICVQYKSK